FTIRNSLFAVVGLLVAAVIVYSSLSALRSLDERAMAERALQDSLTSDAFLNAARGWSLERGVMNTVLNLSEAGTAQFRSRINDARRASEAAYVLALQGLKERPDFAGRDELVKQIEE